MLRAYRRENSIGKVERNSSALQRTEKITHRFRRTREKKGELDESAKKRERCGKGRNFMCKTGSESNTQIKDIKAHGFEENVIAVGTESGQGGYALSYLNAQDRS